MALMLHRRCLDCTTVYSVLEHNGETVGLDAEDDSPFCPKCSSTSFEGAVVAPAPINRRFPYFDRGLGVWLNSDADRRRICAERGLVPVDGDFDEQEAFNESDENKHHREVWNDYTDRLEHSPEFADARRLRDKGHPEYQWKYVEPEMD